MSPTTEAVYTGGCLCGGVRYRFTGPCRDVIICHCENCRRTHGHVSAYTALPKARFELLGDATLAWYHDASPDTQRGFCRRCGASLFWDANDGAGRISVAAGSLDDSRGLRTVGHVFLVEAGKYYTVDDGLPRFPRGSGGAFERDGGG